MLKKLRYHIATGLQRLSVPKVSIERLNGCGVGAWVRTCRKGKGISR